MNEAEQRDPAANDVQTVPGARSEMDVPTITDDSLFIPNRFPIRSTDYLVSFPITVPIPLYAFYHIGSKAWPFIFLVVGIPLIIMLYHALRSVSIVIDREQRTVEKQWRLGSFNRSKVYNLNTFNPELPK